MESIDTNKRKPRRTYGTPSYKYRNRFAYAFIAAGTALFGIWCLTPIQRFVNEKFLKELSQRSEVEIDRRGLFDFAAPRTAESIRETIAEKERLLTER